MTTEQPTPPPVVLSTALLNPLPCPFCGSAEVGHTNLDYREFVICNVCGAMADSIDTLPERTPLQVWNMRFNAEVKGDTK